MLPDPAKEPRHVFQSVTNRRWLGTRSALAVAGFGLLAAVVILAATMLSQSELSKVRTARALNSAEASRYLKNQRREVEQFRQSRRTVETFLARRARNPFYHGSDTNAMRAAFLVNWDAASYSSLARHINNLNAVFVEWSRLIAGRTDSLIFDADSNAVKLLAKHPEINVHCMVSNYDENTQSWRGDILESMLRPEHARAQLVKTIADLAQTNHFFGINIDFEDIPSPLHPYVHQFLRELQGALHREGAALSVDVPADDDNFDLRTYSQLTDYVVLMDYDQHSADQAPGPISANDWFIAQVERATRYVPSHKLIVGLAAYGYDWTTEPSGQTHVADEITFEQAVVQARESDTTLTFDSATGSIHYGFDEDDSTHHDIWLNDAVTTFNQLSFLDQYDIAGTAVWRLGAEDPSLWTIYGDDVSPFTSKTLDEFDTIRGTTQPEYQGDGELLNLIAEPAQGLRHLEYDSADQFIQNEQYTTLPSGYVLQRYGKDAHKVVLTFDDGPDPSWTPKVLDILSAKHAPAAFFVVGVNAERNFRLLKRIYAEGHEIGNHTFTHPNIALISEARTVSELTLTENIIRAACLVNTILFRPPYNADAEPTTIEELEPVARAARLGYTMAGETIDPRDWSLPVTAKQIVDSCLAQLSLGSIILLHDAGGDRSATIEALPILIDSLRARGLELSSLSAFAGVQRSQFMQPLTGSKLRDAQIDNTLLLLLFYVQRTLYAIFFAAIIAAIARMLAIAALAITQWRREREERSVPLVLDHAPPKINVIIPAYNENIVVIRTIETVLASRYPSFNVTVVDDGSTDDTFAIVADKYKDHPGVQVFTKPNGGKASALNYGIARSEGEIIVVIDADTIFDSEALNELAYYFEKDARVGGVAGNVKVGNVMNLLTRWQAIEYTSSQNFDRRAFELLGAITVVPGAIGAFRRTALLEVGSYTSDTLAEDTDLTMRLVRAGWRVRYAERAKAWTEAPEKIRPFVKQRFRWTFGTMQSFWKHRDALFNARAGGLGLVAMPNILIFQILLPLLAPVVDLIFIISLFSGHTDVTLESYLLFLAIDLLGSIIAFSLEGERLTILVWLPLQRFLYRQLMYYVLFKSVFAALRGQLQGWGKLQRTGSVAMTNDN
ncbi:MAG: glycosyltransferase [Bacteroidota bacterium]|nr:glycosyltransferase [Bacteroidota bacterium]MDP4234001.1 glycosyltransferase [Bacteroidota bacterium]MDP4287694.1 glycosyltransferase [Bacteroidota bacterium]